MYLIASVRPSVCPSDLSQLNCLTYDLDISPQSLSKCQIVVRMQSIRFHFFTFSILFWKIICSLMVKILHTKDAKAFEMNRKAFEMNRLAVGRSARAQQAHKVDNRIDQLHKVDNRIDQLMALYKTDTDTQNLSRRSIVLFRSR